MKAARLFDETKGFKFISYAVWRIRQSILYALAQQGHIVRLPQNKIALNFKVRQKFDELLQDYQREPTPQEIADSLDVLLEDVE